jgi:hypothetical protein
MPSITKKNQNYNNALLWRNAIYTSSNVCPVAYVFIGNHLPYSNEIDPNTIKDTIVDEKDAWDKMYAAKRVTANDIELVIPKVNWLTNSKYNQYDDTVTISDLVRGNTTLGVKPMYVITSDRNVYKCVSNNSSANSTVEPTGDYTTSNGNIATADGYIWKYMYNVKPSNKFLTDNWIPAPQDTTFLDYSVSNIGVVDGELTTIVVTNVGSNYRQASNVVVDSFTTGQTTLRLTSTALILNVFSISALSNLANMAISGTGLPADTYISSIDNSTGIITLSNATTSSGGGGSNITINTRIYIQGDGTGAVATATISNTTSGVSAANANISKVTITTIGTGYSSANVFVYGSGFGANARAILSPKYGHAFNPAKELNANNVMASVRIGEIDTTENGLISANTSFRQFGLLKDPHKYGSNTSVQPFNANTVISQTTNLNIVAGLNYTLNEYVYQGSSPTDALAYGYVNAQTSNGVRLTQVKGTFRPGLSLIGTTSGISRTVTTVSNPEFQPYSGDILYIENAISTGRTDGQAENIKLIISF